MKRITINNKEYIFEFSIEASLYDDCTKSVMDMLINASAVQAAANDNNTANIIESISSSVADLPHKTLKLFYAGLLEHHGPEGDKSVQGLNDAKALLKQYLKSENKSFRDVYGEMMELMGTDSFFELIGLDKMLKETTEEVEKLTENGEVGENTSTEK